MSTFKPDTPSMALHGRTNGGAGRETARPRRFRGPPARRSDRWHGGAAAASVHFSEAPSCPTPLRRTAAPDARSAGRPRATVLPGHERARKNRMPMRVRGLSRRCPSRNFGAGASMPEASAARRDRCPNVPLGRVFVLSAAHRETPARGGRSGCAGAAKTLRRHAHGDRVRTAAESRTGQEARVDHGPAL